MIDLYCGASFFFLVKGEAFSHYILNKELEWVSTPIQSQERIDLRLFGQSNKDKDLESPTLAKPSANAF